LELFGEKNRLGRGSNLGQAGGNLCLWGPERFFSIVRNAQYNYPLFGRTLFFNAPSTQLTRIPHLPILNIKTVPLQPKAILFSWIQDPDEGIDFEHRLSAIDSATAREYNSVA